MAMLLIDECRPVARAAVRVPRGQPEGASLSDWRSVGDAVGHVLSSVAYRYCVASSAYPTLRTEDGERGNSLPVAVSAE